MHALHHRPFQPTLATECSRLCHSPWVCPQVVEEVDFGPEPADIVEALELSAPREVLALYDYDNDDERLLSISEGEVRAAAARLQC